jgi:hypothetical protein
MSRTSLAVLRGIGAGVALLFAVGAAHAGRPMLVDDADVDEVGSGHIESWMERQRHDPGRLLVFSPAMVIAPRVEVAASWARERPQGLNAWGVQVKVQSSAGKPGECRNALLAALGRETADRRATPALTAIATCEFGTGALHLNASVLHSPDSRLQPGAGAAWEQPMGPVVGHVEWLVRHKRKPIAAAGVRYSLTENWQIDSSLARGDGKLRWSGGIKYGF